MGAVEGEEVCGWCKGFGEVVVLLRRVISIPSSSSLLDLLLAKQGRSLLSLVGIAAWKAVSGEASVMFVCWVIAQRWFGVDEQTKVSARDERSQRKEKQNRNPKQKRQEISSGRQTETAHYLHPHGCRAT